MRDVAARAGVSLKTVSRVLNDEPGVLPGPAGRVRAAAAALGYQRNESAAALRRTGQSSRTIGLVIEDVGNPFWAGLIKAVEQIARPRGYLLVAGSSDQDHDVERELITSLCARRVDGLLVVPSSRDLGYLSDELAHGTAIVAVDRPLPGLDVDSVVSGNADGARAAVDHLVELGHRRIGYVGDTATYTSAERLRGYRQALAAHDIADDPQLLRVAHDVPAAQAATRELLDSTPAVTALFTGNNLLTRGAIRALAQRRHDVALIGFDDFALADLLEPSVSVVAQDPAALGRQAAELLFARIEGDAGPRRQVVLSTELIVRGSSLPAA